MAATQSLPLKDLHLPDSVSWWPPALGYWLLLVTIITLTVLTYFLWRRFQQTKLKRLALRSYKQIITDYQNDKDAKKLTTHLSALLRNTAIASYGRDQCASLTGTEWLTWLDAQIQSKKTERSFCQNCQQLLIRFNYNQESDHAELNDFIHLSRHWLKQLPRQEVNKQ